MEALCQLAIFATLILLGWGVGSAREKSHLRSLARRRVPAGTMLLGALLLGFVLRNMALYLPVRFSEGPKYGNVSDALRSELNERALHNVVVFTKTEGLLFNEGFWMNDPFMRSNRIFAIDLGDEKNRELLRRYPGYTGYRWDRRTLTRIDG